MHCVRVHSELKLGAFKIWAETSNQLRCHHQGDPGPPFRLHHPFVLSLRLSFPFFHLSSFGVILGEGDRVLHSGRSLTGDGIPVLYIKHTAAVMIHLGRIQLDKYN